MKRVRVFKIPIVLVVSLLLLVSQPASGQPTLQVYIVGAVPDGIGPDQHTWFTTDASFDLIVVGAYKDGTTNLTEVTILVSVLEEQEGTITISGGDVGATLLTTPQPTVIPGVFNPETNADDDPLGASTGYDTKDFLPDDITFNNHYPLQNDISDFVIYGIGDFDDLYLVNNYNADLTDPDFVDPLDPAFPPLTGHLGEEKTFTVTITGFTRVHFDAYGYEAMETLDLGPTRSLVSTWDINPGSHDATYIPAPGAILLGSIGLVLVGWLRRRRTI